jgi:hypothetical protein
VLAITRPATDSPSIPLEKPNQHLAVRAQFYPSTLATSTVAAPLLGVLIELSLKMVAPEIAAVPLIITGPDMVNSPEALEPVWAKTLGTRQ